MRVLGLEVREGLGRAVEHPPALLPPAAHLWGALVKEALQSLDQPDRAVACPRPSGGKRPNPPTSLIFLCARWKLLGPPGNDYRCPAAAQKPHGRWRGAPAPLGRARDVPASPGGALRGNTGRTRRAHVCAHNLPPIAGSLAHIESFPARGRPAPRWKAEKVWVPAGYLTLACAKPIRSQAAPYEDLELIWITLVLNRASF